MPVRVAVDAMGGDQAPAEIVAGAVASRGTSVEPILYGPRDVVEPIAGVLEIRRLPAVHRPAIAVPIPARRGTPCVLVDAGANADARPEHLVQFAAMGALFAQEVLDIPDPEVRLLSIGEEAEKGNRLTREATPLLESSGLRFAGNTEGRDLLDGPCDVVVCDGFTGNVVLKCLEGTIRSVLRGLREEIEA